MKYYLAGGAVRSLLLGELPHDLDFVFSGSGQDFLALNPSARKLGENAIYELNNCEYAPLGPSIKNNLQERDFTINSFLLENNGILHMHPNALSDLRSCTIAPASDTSLQDDPLRIFRAARFCASYPEFTPSTECLQSMRSAAKTTAFTLIAAERVGRECLKALQGQKPGNFLRILEQGNALEYWFEELAGSGQIPAGPPQYHNSDVLEHIARIMDGSSKELDNWAKSENTLTEEAIAELRTVTVWMSLCHDLGKVSTPSEILPHHYLHEVRGMQAALDLADRLRLSSRLRAAGLLSAKLHMKAGIYSKLRPSTRVDLLMEAHTRDLIIPLFLVAQADSGLSGLLNTAMAELKHILKIKLPPKWENKGKDSGRQLREMRCNALARMPKP
ncbi:hypothetical protein LJB93_00685 [Desulfovibrio sp. OttesenSCG-928-F07]|nr:hypothetical protein [Desulfovibrio sp. OttesenSCG-928-F07]